MNAPRRAVLVDAYPHVYGGAQRTDHLLARELPARGWRLEIVTPAGGPFPDRLRAEDLPVTVLEAPRALRTYGRATTGWAAVLALVALPAYWLRLARWLRATRAEVVHIVDHRGLVLALLPARLARARTVWHVQALDRSRLLNRVGARLAHTVVVPSAAVVPKLRGLGRPRDLRVVPNVVATPAPPLGPLAGAPVVVTTARLHPDKGLDLLIDALVLVRHEVPDARVVVLGGPQEGFEHLPDELRARARQAGVADAVDLAGFVDAPAEVVRSARVYVQPARERTEILPLAMLEAMASGAPVVATDVGGVRDLVHDGETGLLVPPDDVPALARALVRVLRDDELAERLRRAGRALAEEPRFTVDGLVDAVAAAYDGRSVG